MVLNNFQKTNLSIFIILSQKNHKKKQIDFKLLDNQAYTKG